MIYLFWSQLYCLKTIGYYAFSGDGASAPFKPENIFSKLSKVVD